MFEDTLEIHMEDQILFVQPSSSTSLEKFIFIFNYCKSDKITDEDALKEKMNDSISQSSTDNNKANIYPHLSESLKTLLNNLMMKCYDWKDAMGIYNQELYSSLETLGCSETTIEKLQAKNHNAFNIVLDELFSHYRGLFKSLMIDHTVSMDENSIKNKRLSRTELYSSYQELLCYWTSLTKPTETTSDEIKENPSVENEMESRSSEEHEREANLQPNIPPSAIPCPPTPCPSTPCPPLSANLSLTNLLTTTKHHRLLNSPDLDSPKVLNLSSSVHLLKQASMKYEIRKGLSAPIVPPFPFPADSDEDRSDDEVPSISPVYGSSVPQDPQHPPLLTSEDLSIVNQYINKYVMKYENTTKELFDEENKISSEVYIWGEIKYKECEIDEYDHVFPSLYTKNITGISSGDDTTLFLTDLGDVYSYKSTSLNPPSLIEATSINRALYRSIICSVSAGQSHCLAITTAGHLYAWGKNYNGELGLGHEESVSTPTLVSSLCSYKIKECSCGYTHSAAVSEQNQVFTWGANDCGQLGLSTVDKSNIPVLSDYFSDKKIQHVVCGFNITLFIDENGDLYGCGESENYQLAVSQEIVSTPIRIPVREKENDVPIQQVSRWPIVLIYGAVLKVHRYAWGWSDEGALGIQSQKGRVVHLSTPTPLSLYPPLESNEKILKIDSGYQHNIALTNKDHLYMWGLQESGRIPSNTIHESTILFCPTRLDLHSEEYMKTHSIADVCCGYYNTLVVYKSKVDARSEIWSSGDASELVIPSSSISQNWEALLNQNSMNGFIRTPAFKQLVQEGIPMTLRARVWELLIGNRLRISKTQYGNLEYTYQLLKNEVRSTSSTSHSFAEVLSIPDIAQNLEKDLPRTFSEYQLFTRGNPLYVRVAHMLELFNCYRSDIGYHQIMSYIAGYLSLFIQEDYSLFSCFANLMFKYHFLNCNRYQEDCPQEYSRLFESYIESEYPSIYAHLTRYHVQIGFFFLSWIQTLYLSLLPLNYIYRIWDLFLMDGFGYLYKVGISILALLEKVILESGEEELLSMFTKKNLKKIFSKNNINEETLVNTSQSMELKDVDARLNEIEDKYWELR